MHCVMRNSKLMLWDSHFRCTNNYEKINQRNIDIDNISSFEFVHGVRLAFSPPHEMRQDNKRAVTRVPTCISMNPHMKYAQL